MKNKWLAAPYVVWMAIFVVAPLILVVVFAFTEPGGSLTLDNFSNMAHVLPAFRSSFVLAVVATVICILIGYPLAYFLSRETPDGAQGGHDAHHAAHVDELPAADLRLDVHAGATTALSTSPGRHRLFRPAQRLFGTNLPGLPR